MSRGGLDSGPAGEENKGAAPTFRRRKGSLWDEALIPFLKRALMLPAEERITLASRLLESVSTDDATMSVDGPSLIEELDRRFADREGGHSLVGVAGGGLMPTGNVIFHRLALPSARGCESFVSGAPAATCNLVMPRAGRNAGPSARVTGATCRRGA